MQNKPIMPLTGPVTRDELVNKLWDYDTSHGQNGFLEQLSYDFGWKMDAEKYAELEEAALLWYTQNV